MNRAQPHFPETPMNATASTPTPAARPSQARIWFQAVRFFSFTASSVPIIVASALALVDRAFDPVLVVVMLLASIACHAGANLANDYFDHVKGIDTPVSLGPSKVIQQGLLSPAQVKRGMVVAFAVATALGLFIVSQSGWPILALALASLGAAVLYTGGPKPLGYVALGELTVFIFMGPVMIGGAYYVMADRITWPVVVASLPVGLLVAAILHANNIRDIPDDTAAGKVTLATKLGRHGANIEFAILTYGAYLALVGLVGLRPELWPVLAAFTTIPVARRLNQLTFSDAMDKALNPLVRKSAGLHLRFGLLLTAGLVIATFIDRIG